MYYNTRDGQFALFRFLTWQIPSLPAPFIPERSHSTPGGCRNFEQPLFVSANTNGFIRFIFLVENGNFL